MISLIVVQAKWSASSCGYTSWASVNLYNLV